MEWTETFQSIFNWCLCDLSNLDNFLLWSWFSLVSERLLVFFSISFPVFYKIFFFIYPRMSGFLQFTSVFCFLFFLSLPFCHRIKTEYMKTEWGLKNLLLWNTILSYLQMQLKFSNRCFRHQQLTVLILNSILKIRDEETNVVWNRFFPTILPLILSFVHRNLIIEQSKMVWILSTSLYY